MVCLSACLHIYVYMCVYAYVSVCLCMYVCMYVCMCVSVCVYVCVCVSVCLCCEHKCVYLFSICCILQWIDSQILCVPVCVCYVMYSPLCRWLLSLSIYLFNSLFPRKPAVDATEALAAFEVFDQNGNGFMSIDELINVLKNLGEGMPDDMLEKLKKVAEPDDEQQVHTFPVPLWLL